MITMKQSTERIAATKEAEPVALSATARLTRLPAKPSGNDAAHGTPALGEEAWPWHLVPPGPESDSTFAGSHPGQSGTDRQDATRKSSLTHARPSDADATEAAVPAWPLSY